MAVLTCSSRYMFWVLVACTIITVLITIFMMYRMSQRPAMTAPAAGRSPASSFEGGASPAPIAESFLEQESLVAGAVVYLYMNGCGWCERFHPVWQDFASRYQGPLQLRKIEASDPEAARYDVAGYPTVLLVRSDGSTAKFSGDRTVENLMQFAA